MGYLVIGESSDESFTVKMKININQMRQQPLGIPAILLWVLHFQIPRKW